MKFVKRLRNTAGFRHYTGAWHIIMTYLYGKFIFGYYLFKYFYSILLHCQGKFSRKMQL